VIKQTNFSVYITGKFVYYLSKNAYHHLLDIGCITKVASIPTKAMPLAKYQLLIVSP